MSRDYVSRAEIEDALRQLAAAIDPLPAPDYADRVTALLADGTRARRHTWRPVWGARRVLLALAVVLIAAGVLVAVPGTRHALASWFGFRGIKIHSAPGTQTVTQLPTPAPLDAGRQVTLAEAQHAAADRIALPRHVPEPTRVYLRRDGSAVVITLAYRTVPSLKPAPETGYALIVTEIFDAGEPVLEKILHAGAIAEPVQIHGNAGVYIRGPQEIINIDRPSTGQGSETVHEVPPRISANTLIWSVDTATYRIEGAFTRDAAVGLANSFT
jgi:hypothetical protein